MPPDTPGRGNIRKVLKTRRASSAIASLGKSANCGVAANPASCDDDIALIADRCLTRRDRLLRLIQPDKRAIAIERDERRGRSGVAVTDLHRHCQPFARCLAATPVNPVDFKFLDQQILGLADKNSSRRGINIDDVTRSRRTAGQTLRCPMVNISMPSCSATKLPDRS